MKFTTSMLLILASGYTFAQTDVQVGTNHQLNIQRQNQHADAFILHNAEYSSGDDNLKWKTVDSNFGSRGVRFSYGTTRGMYFYADETAPQANLEFTPTTRFFIGNNGKIGIGTVSPTQLLQIGENNQRGIGIRLGERATFGLTSTHAETVIGNNAYVEGENVKTYFQDGASAITMKWNNGIHFYVTGASPAPAANIAINTASFEKMRINSQGVFADQVTVELQNTWPDYVFEDEYLLPSLKETEKFIGQYDHLPGVPTAPEVQQRGINLGQMDAILLEKIEQLTLYLIEQNKKIEKIISENTELQKELKKLQINNSAK
jgi:hypothetical protein